MNNKKISIVIVLLLLIFIILFISYNNIISDNTNDLKDNNTINKPIKNNSNTNEEKNVDKNSTKQNNYSAKQYSTSKHKVQQKNYSNKSKNKTEEFTAKAAKRSVETDNVFSFREESNNIKVKVGYPKYKNDNGGWLVPAYNKKTGEFVGSVYVYGKHGPYSHGPESYYHYKSIISGKKIKEDTTDGFPIKAAG